MPTAEQPQKPRKPRRDKGLIMATERDLHVLSWIAHQYACRLDHIRELLSREAGAPTKENGQIALSTTKDLIDRWRRAGWIEYQRFLANEPAWAWVTRSGLSLVGLDDLYVAKAPSPVRYRHIHAVNQVRLHRVLKEYASGWISERQLRAEMSLVKKHPAHVPAVVQIAEGVIPDAVIAAASQVEALEVELTPKKPEETRAKLAKLCAATYFTLDGKEYIYDLIQFFVPDAKMQQHIERARSYLSKANQERVRVRVEEALQHRPE